MVSDRSYGDLGGYFWYKEWRSLGECEMEDFLCECKSLMEDECDVGMLLGLNVDSYKDWWMEDNGKRIVKRLLEVEIWCVMGELVGNWEIGSICICEVDLGMRREEMN